MDDDVDALATRLESLKAKSRSMLEEASQLEAGIDASENDEVISESTRFKRAPQSSPGLPTGKMGVSGGDGDGEVWLVGIPPVAVAAAAAAHDQRAPRRRHRDRRTRRGGRRVRRGRRRGLRARPRRRRRRRRVRALLKAGQFIGSNLKEKAVPSLGQQEGKAKAKEGAASKAGGGGYVAPKQAAAATKIDEKKAAAKPPPRRRMPTLSPRRPPS